MNLEQSSSTNSSSSSTSSVGLTPVMERGPQHAQHQHQQQHHPTPSSSSSRPVVRRTPPSAFRTPSHNGKTSHNNYSRQQQQHSTMHYPQDSPFLSPPPTSVPNTHQKQQQQQQRNQQQLQYYYQNFASPFASPPPTMEKQQQPARRRQQQVLEPLILDPQKRPPVHHNHHHTSTTTPNHHYPSSTPVEATPNASSLPVVGKLFEAAARGMVRQESGGSGGLHHATPMVPSHYHQQQHHQQQPACVIARAAPQAGFLQKLGANIPEFKRRFFILQPETNLYYYLSPNDTEPRGKINLNSATIQEWECTPDGRYRFGISWNNNNDDDDHDERKHPYDTENSHHHKQQRRRQDIILEARSKEIGQEWMEQMENLKVSTLKTKVEQLQNQTRAQEHQIQDLQKVIDNFKMIEQDRDGALEDARKWKEQFETLDEALRLLTRQIYHQNNNNHHPASQSSPSSSPPRSHNGATSIPEEEKKDDTTDQTATTTFHGGEQEEDYWEEQESTDKTPTKTNKSNKHHANAETPAIDDDEEKEKEVETSMSFFDEEAFKELVVPGSTYFSALSNACQQQRESLHLASMEAATAVDDIKDAHERLEAMKKRMEKAEKHLTKLWEENCTIRKTLKQKKREKRVLVREVKALQQLTKDLANQTQQQQQPPAHHHQQQQQQPRNATSNNNVNDSFTNDDTVGSDEERLIVELEDHLTSSIQLHERFLQATHPARHHGKARTAPPVMEVVDPGTEGDLNTSMDDGSVFGPKASNINKDFQMANHFDASNGSDHGGQQQSPIRPTALQPKLSSLLDNGSESEESDGNDEEDDEDDVAVNEYESIGPSISSVAAEMGDECGGSIASGIGFAPIPSGDTDDSPERPNPLLELDKEDIDDYDKPPNLCPTSSQSASSKSVVTDNGQATARLSCPLADAIETKVGPNAGTAVFEDHINIYHLTFHSKKIGIQFQKAPPAPSKPKGLLTAALTADMANEPDGAENTADEPRRVDEISSIASGRHMGNDYMCQVAMPEDIVLVCGFDGFDDSGSNQRPKLGARLVAFDGVSVEVGRWTFDGIRKAIKARGRPLTLSFRNDYLTSEQRAVLTKAVMDVDAKCPPVRHMVPYGVRQRPPSTTPSINSAISHESDHFVNGSGGNQMVLHEDDQSATPSTASSNCCRQKLASASSSISSQYGRIRRLSMNSTSTHHSNFRSFSEAGSSISTTFAPLVANLMKGVAEKKDEFTPQYLQQAPASIEQSPQHLDFQSNLL